MWFKLLVLPVIWIGAAVLLKRSKRLTETDKGVIALILVIGAAIMWLLQIRSVGFFP